MVTPAFNPKKCQYGLWPVKTKPTISSGAAGQVVGYLQSVLKCTSGQVQLNIRANPGPWDFGPMTDTAVRNFQSFWRAQGAANMVVDGIVGPITWGYIDWAAKGFPH